MDSRFKKVSIAAAFLTVITCAGMYGTGYYFGQDFKNGEKCSSMGGNPMASFMAAAMVGVAIEAHMANSTDPYIMKLGAGHGLKKAILQCLFAK